MFIGIKEGRLYKTSPEKLKAEKDVTIVERSSFSKDEIIKLNLGAGMNFNGTINLTGEVYISNSKSKAINELATLSDQLNLLASVCYKLTEGSTDPEILAARKVLEDIRIILKG